jgi:hypothetical protein
VPPVGQGGRLEQSGAVLAGLGRRDAMSASGAVSKRAARP